MCDRGLGMNVINMYKLYFLATKFFHESVNSITSKLTSENFGMVPENSIFKHLKCKSTRFFPSRYEQ